METSTRVSFALVTLLALPLEESFSAPVDDVPTVGDPRLELKLFAREPDIVTPVGIVVDANHRILVIESHTHARPRKYEGPGSDRVKIFVDEDRDGTPEKVSVFAEGLHQALTLTLSPDGKLYVCSEKVVTLLEDRDGDGRCDHRSEILKLNTSHSNHHGCLLGVTFWRDGWLYISRGAIGGSPYSLVGSDGSTIRGHGEGGNIVRCHPDGSGLERVATGFWNPFYMHFDVYGRLLCIDNDPDGQGPNRLLHIIQGGDYGLALRYGNRGFHPFQAWDGELPGTLPMIGGVGEAPTGVLDCNRAALPLDYRDNILVTVWGDHSVTRFRPKKKGVSLQGKREFLVRGGRMFRPSNIVAAPDGTIFITDWVDRRYPVHGKGRIWRLKAKPGVATSAPPGAFDPPKPDPGMSRIRRLLAVQSADRYAELRDALTSEDPFVRSAAVTALARPAFRQNLLADSGHEDQKIRLGVLLGLRRGKYEDPVPILKKFLADPSEDVRKMALIWAGEDVLLPLKNDLERAVAPKDVSPELFRTYLAATQLVSQRELDLLRKNKKFSRSRHPLGTSVVAPILHAESCSPAIRAMALVYVDDLGEKAVFSRVLELTRAEDPRVRLEAVRTLVLSNDRKVADELESIAFDGQRPAEIRALAVLGFVRVAPDRRKHLLQLLQDPAPVVRGEAARGLRLGVADPEIRKALAGAGPAAVGPASESGRPSTDAQWREVASLGGDAGAGWRVFFHPLMNCGKCHRAGGRGGSLGPDLSKIHRSSGRDRIVDSILNPRAEMGPEYQMYKVLFESGKLLTGFQFHFRGESATLMLHDGAEIRFPLADIVSHEPMTTSIMPDDLEQQMTMREFRDLIAFLTSLK